MTTTQTDPKTPLSEVPSNPKALLSEVLSVRKVEFEKRKSLLSFQDFADVFFEKPHDLSRHSAAYIKDMIDSYGIETQTEGPGPAKRHYKVFALQRNRIKPPIIGQEEAHEQIYRILEQFVRQGRTDKLILLHGPNGSSKSSTAEAIAGAMEEYSQSESGPVYFFNWIFPNDKIGVDEPDDFGTGSKRIGFGDLSPNRRNLSSYAYLAENEILCKITSEFRENPIFLLPKEERIAFFTKAVAAKGTPVSEESVPRYLEEGDLSSKNRKIFDALLLAYQGDVEKVLRHVQVERFFFSSRYRKGLATVEPQMSVDAQERQLTMDRNVQNIPTVLQNIRLFEPSGDLVDANRGLIEFSDLLKRPLETFKYLLTTVEKMSINLVSGMADLDTVMLASTNEKHLDAFKASPDWPSFKGRFELIRVPYLLSSKKEALIYQQDILTIRKTKPITRHVIELLSTWAVLTRLRQPDPETFDFQNRGLVARLQPTDKLALYDGDEPSSQNYSETERNSLKKLVIDLRAESHVSVAYEGRFGASPREMKMLLYFAAQSAEYDQLNPLSVFEEIEKLIQDRSVYDYLQFETRGGYHDCKEFLNRVRHKFAVFFQKEFLQALNLFNEEQYVQAFEKYLKYIVSFVKNEKMINEHTGKSEEPSEKVMTDIEDLLGLKGDKREIRERFVSRIAAWRLENSETKFEVLRVFEKEIDQVFRAIYDDKKELIETITHQMLMWGTEDFKQLTESDRTRATSVFQELESKFGYTQKSSWQFLVFQQNFKPN